MLNLQSIYFGQNNKDFDYKDFDVVKKVARLAHKHHRQCENDCNGYGWVKGKFYHCDGSVDGSYVGEDTIFDVEIGGIENKIAKVVDNLNQSKYGLWRIKPLVVTFQHDPRGNMVKLTYNGSYIEL